MISEIRQKTPAVAWWFCSTRGMTGEARARKPQPRLRATRFGGETLQLPDMFHAKPHVSSAEICRISLAGTTRLVMPWHQASRRYVSAVICSDTSPIRNTITAALHSSVLPLVRRPSCTNVQA